MAKIISLNIKKVFALEDLNELVPVFLRITAEAKSKTDELLNQLYSLTEVSPGSELAKGLEAQVDQIILLWQSKIEKLGGKTRGLWLADFDSGDGYYCWKYPEKNISHWHKYSEAFASRIPISQKSVLLGSVPNHDSSF